MDMIKINPSLDNILYTTDTPADVVFTITMNRRMQCADFVIILPKEMLFSENEVLVNVSGNGRIAGEGKNQLTIKKLFI